jgi:hypothetical protein
MCRLAAVTQPRISNLVAETILPARLGVTQGSRCASCHSAWGPNADRRGNFLNCLREEGSNSKADSHQGLRCAVVFFVATENLLDALLSEER